MWSKGINRNIVECKVNFLSPFHSMDTVLIETLWNVKQVVLLAVILICSVLIETLWNVKQISQSTVRVIVAVLIETLWNVKRKTSPFRHRMILY